MDIDFKYAKEAAQKILNSSEEFSKRPVDLVKIIKSLNLDISFSENIEEKSLLDPKKRMLFIKKDTQNINKKLFAIACEIGHWVLHSRDRIRYKSDYSIMSERALKEEHESTFFAMELLMPFEEVRQLILKGYTIEGLMEHFNVSSAFATSRYNHISKNV